MRAVGKEATVKQMQAAVIGEGRVGWLAGVCLIDSGLRATFVDANQR